MLDLKIHSHGKNAVFNYTYFNKVLCPQLEKNTGKRRYMFSRTQVKQKFLSYSNIPLKVLFLT